WVPRLAALDHGVDTEPFQDPAEALAAGDGDDRLGLGLWRRLLRLARKAMVLSRHVVDLEPAQSADPAGVADDGSGLVGVHVDLDRGLIAHDHRRLALTYDLPADVVQGQVVSVDDELGAVSPALLRSGHRPGSRVLGRRPGQPRQVLAAHLFEEALEDHLQPE